jgi:hypothetical protein
MRFKAGIGATNTAIQNFFYLVELQTSPPGLRTYIDGRPALDDIQVRRLKNGYPQLGQLDRAGGETPEVG